MTPVPARKADPLVPGALALIALAVMAYLPSLRGQFVWDDNTMLSQNGLIQGAGGLRRIWLTTQGIDYWPVTSSTFWLEWRLWAAHPAGYHLTNLALHVAGVLLVWSVLRRLHVPGALVGALVFAVHPVNVESVAWISQRKNLLALIFYLLSIRCFLESEDAVGTRSRAWHLLSVLCFAGAMLSKGSTAMLPAVLLGLILWRRRPLLRDWLRLIPYAAIAAALVVLDIRLQRRDAGDWVRSAGFPERALGAAAAVWFYLAKAVLPLRLAFVYPRWRVGVGQVSGWCPLAAASAGTGLLWRLARRPRTQNWARPALFAWGYFCVSLVPVMGLTDVYFMRFSPVADHYEHLAVIAVAAAAGAAWAGWSRRRRVLPAALAAAVLAGFTALTWRQCLAYRDSETLFQTALRRNSGCWLAHNNLGVILRNKGNAELAAEHFREAVRLNPDYADARCNLGLVFTDAGRFEQAEAQYRKVLQSDPSFRPAIDGMAAAEVDWAAALLQSGGGAEAARHCEQALKLKPGLAEARFVLGNALLQEDETAEAVEQFRTAFRLRPDYAEAGNNLATSLYRLGRTAEAAQALEQVLRVRPDYADAHYNLGVALAALGRGAEAAAQFEEADRLRSSAQAGR